MDPSFRQLVSKMFPEKELIEIPPNHDLFNIHYQFKEGLPKIHEHDGKPPQLFGLFDEKRIIVLYSYESDLGDGWEDEEVHNNPTETRLNALKMGVNIIYFALTQ